MASRTRGPYTCSNCGTVGHTRATCTSVSQDAPVSRSTSRRGITNEPGFRRPTSNPSTRSTSSTGATSARSTSSNTSGQPGGGCRSRRGTKRKRHDKALGNRIRSGKQRQQPSSSERQKWTVKTGKVEGFLSLSELTDRAIGEDLRLDAAAVVANTELFRCDSLRLCYFTLWNSLLEQRLLDVMNSHLQPKGHKAVEIPEFHIFMAMLMARCAKQLKVKEVIARLSCEGPIIASQLLTQTRFTQLNSALRLTTHARSIKGRIPNVDEQKVSLFLVPS